MILVDIDFPHRGWEMGCFSDWMENLTENFVITEMFYVSNSDVNYYLALLN